MNKYAKTVMIAIILIATAMMSGCLEVDGEVKEDVTLERMVQLEAILTDPEISEEEKIAAYTLAHEAITGEKIELNSEANVTPTPKPTLTSTNVTPTITPTIAATPTVTATPKPDPKPPISYRISAIVDWMQWDTTESTIALVLITDNQGCERDGANQLNCLYHIEVFVDGISVASLDTTIIKGHTRMEVEECPMIINLQNKVTKNSEVTIIGSYIGTEQNPTLDGDYPIIVDFRTPPLHLEEEYSEYPVWNI